MKHIIKLRAWHRVKKQWWYNFWHDSQDGSIQAFDEDDKQLSPNDFDVVEWTGLTDKNGKEIYEGDVVATCWHDAGEIHTECPAFKNPYQVEWNGYEYILTPTVWGREHHASVRRVRDFLVENTTDEKMEVIGSIYENPELLKL